MSEHKPPRVTNQTIADAILRAMGNQDGWCTPFDVWRDLEAQGLAIVPAADVPSAELQQWKTWTEQLRDDLAAARKAIRDVPSAEERKVLEACAEPGCGEITYLDCWAESVWKAELARRAAKGSAK